MRISFESVLQDVRYSLRGFARSPGFTSIMIATLAIGIGAATSVFSIVDPLLFRPLPYPEDQRLVSVGFNAPLDSNEFHLANSYLDWKEKQTVFSSFTSMMPATQCDLELAGNAQRVPCVQVESDFLRTFGILVAHGRDFTPDDDREGAPKVALISYALWRSAFGSDPNATGKEMIIDEQRVRIAGVLPADFEMPQLGKADILLPEQWRLAAARAPNSTVFLRTFARLKPGVSIEQARAQLQPLFQISLQKNVPPPLRPEVKLQIRSLRERQIQDSKTASWMLIGAVAALLLLACANVANLMLARSAMRRRELAMKAAIGAGRGRLIRQTLTEAFMLGVGGALLGCALAWALLHGTQLATSDLLEHATQARLDWRVLTFATLLSLGVAMFAGVGPALERPRAESLLGRTISGTRSIWLRQGLVMLQVAVSLLLLTAATLFATSLNNLRQQPLGFQPERLTTATLNLRRQRYNTPQSRLLFYRQLEDRLRSLPGAAAVAISDSIPPRGAMGRPYSNMRVAGMRALQQNGGMVTFRYVTPGYFDAMRIPIVLGRAFTESDRIAGESPLILNRTLARRMFGSGNPIGQRVDLEGEGKYCEIVGIAGDSRNNGLTGPIEPEYYRLRMQDSTQVGRTAVLLIRSTLDSASLQRWLREQVQALDSTLRVQTESMETRIASFQERPRLLTLVLGYFAACGLALATVGIYGVLSFLVQQRTREIGVRMAIGAARSDIAWLVNRQALLWMIGGSIVGIAATLATARLARSLLFGVSPQDPRALGIALLALFASALCAVLVPLWRATRVDPAEALRYE